LGGSVHTVKENAEALVVANKETGLDVNADKTKYMVMPGDKNAGRSHNVNIDESCMYSFGYFPGVRLWFADVSEPYISSIFKGWM